MSCSGGGREGVKLFRGGGNPLFAVEQVVWSREERGVHEAKIDWALLLGWSRDELATTADERGKEKLSDI